MTKLGLPEADALTVATLMAEADLQGSDGHGVTRLPQYARRIKAGGFNVRPNIRVVREQAATRLFLWRIDENPSTSATRDLEQPQVLHSFAIPGSFLRLDIFGYLQESSVGSSAAEEFSSGNSSEYDHGDVVRFARRASER